jgi:hypothetical protein
MRGGEKAPKAVEGTLRLRARFKRSSPSRWGAHRRGTRVCHEHEPPDERPHRVTLTPERLQVPFGRTNEFAPARRSWRRTVRGLPAR